MQKVLNYGSYLQAYALKQMLLNNGANSVSFIDIKKGKPLPGFELKERNLKDIFSRLIEVVSAGKLASCFRDYLFIRKVYRSIIANFDILGLNSPLPKRFDLVVIGSDEVFNCCQKSEWGYDLQLYGDIPEADKVISYAGSFGHTTLEQLYELGISDEIGKTMSSMEAISVRDQNSKEIVERITGRVPDVHLDPVLIYGYKKEIEYICDDIEEEYVLIYSYHTRINDPVEIDKICKFAHSKGLKLFSVFCRYDWCDKAIIPDSPIEVLKWFKKATHVITDTFHGTIFSIITHSSFCTIIRDSNLQKLSSLLSHLKLSDRKLDNTQCIDDVLSQNIDYTMTEEILDSHRKISQDYLVRHL